MFVQIVVVVLVCCCCGVNFEKWGWIFMCVLGVVFVVLIFGYFFVNFMVGEGIYVLDFVFIVGKFVMLFWQWWDVLMLWFVLIYGVNGMCMIVNDYVIYCMVCKVFVWVFGLVVGLFIIFGMFVVFMFDLCLGVIEDSVLWFECVVLVGN